MDIPNWGEDLRQLRVLHHKLFASPLSEHNFVKPESGTSPSKHLVARTDAPHEITDASKQTDNVILLDQSIHGTPDRLGATVTEQGVNFACKSQGATQLYLLLFDDSKDIVPSQVLPMFKSGDIWHRFVKNLPANCLYLLQADGPYNPAIDGSRFNKHMVLIDPYAKAVTSDTGRPLAYDTTNMDDPNRHLRPGITDSLNKMPRCVAVDTDNFDWQGVQRPNIPWQDRVIYETNLQGFTASNQNIPENLRGTFAGFAHAYNINYLLRLGITSVEFLPLFQFDLRDWAPKNPQTGEQLGNAWGYNTVAFQAPASRFSSSGTRGQQVNEFKLMVRELHRHGIEVILDIVFNHTAEGDQFGPTLSFRGLDNKIYYLLDSSRSEYYCNHTGCGNTFNVNHPRVQEFILDTLRYWHQTMQVDGFRFDLASVFKYDIDGQETNIELQSESINSAWKNCTGIVQLILQLIENDPSLKSASLTSEPARKNSKHIVQLIESDPSLKTACLIAEPWGPDCQYDLGKFGPRWLEWNDKFRDYSRRFFRSQDQQIPGFANDPYGGLADRFAGSYNIFRRKGKSINFITAHDGFTLRDVVSYNEKHNLANGEFNRDGANENFSWDSMEPGDRRYMSPERTIAIEKLRTKSIKNMLAFLFLSQETPMLLAGDEIQRSAWGNNNYWCQPRLNVIDWELLQRNADTFRFTKMMINLRKRHRIGWKQANQIIWHGVEPYNPDFSSSARFMAAEQLPEAPLTVSCYSAFNLFWEPLRIRLPGGRRWRLLVDTDKSAGNEIIESDQAQFVGDEYVISPRSVVVLEAELKGR